MASDLDIRAEVASINEEFSAIASLARGDADVSKKFQN
jgi:hypothetical protein